MSVEAMRNYEEFSKSLRNFHDWMGESAPGAMDLDFFVERKGQFLVIEMKPWQRGVALNYGQHKALHALSKQPNTRVYLAGEDKGERIHLACFNTAPPPVVRRNGRTVCWWPPDRFIPTDRAGLRELVSEWWADASEAA